MRLVEVIPGLKTAPWVAEALIAVARRIGHAPVVCSDSPGFLVNHIGRAYMPEALRIISEQITSFQAVDQIMKKAANFPMGPFELLDLVGADIALAVMESLDRQFYHEPLYRPSPLLASRVQAGLLGRKTKAGFYNYTDGQPAPTATAAPECDLPASVWISPSEPDGQRAVSEALQAAGVSIERGAVPGKNALCIVTPLGDDLTTAVLTQKLDAARSVAVDTMFGLSGHRTIMVSPATSAEARAQAHALLAGDGAAVTIINDSPGFVAQRIVAMIVNVCCNIAQLGIASPTDIDIGARTGLGYPFGPLEFADRLGAQRILRVMEALYAFYGDPRYRPAPWLKRRAALGVSLFTPDFHAHG